MFIVDAENLINTLGMHEDNAIKVPHESNVGTNASIDTRGQARFGGSPKISNLEGEMRQVGINGDREWLSNVKYLIEDRSTRVHKGVIDIAMIMVRAIVSTTFRRAIASAIVVGIISTLMDRMKRSLNFAELIHVTLTGNKALYIKCPLLLRGAIPSRTLA